MAHARLFLCLLLSTLIASPAAADRSGTEAGEWRYWGGDENSSRYSPLDQINADNIEDLEVAWRWRSDNYGPAPDYIYRTTPLYVKGRLYAVAGQRRAVVAIDPATGETLWMWRMTPNPRWEASTRKNYGKGVAWAEVDGKDRLYVITPGYYMVALDPDTGQPIKSFGINGVVDLHLGLGDYPVDADRGVLDSGDITSSSPPIIANGVIVVGNSHDRGYYPNKKENIPGHVRGYDVATGRMLWRFNVLPQEGEFGNDTWETDAWKYTGNISAWAPLSADSELGLVYIPTDTPTNDYYGGDRPGGNLFGTSLIALDIKTGKRAWHYQMVHHDIWNMDNPNAPKLMDLTVKGKRIPAVIETTKQGWVYAFNRKTGEPIWPIAEQAVPGSDVAGEVPWATQPHVSKPPPFELQGTSVDDLIDFTPELRQEAIALASEYRMGPIFTPPSLANHPDGTKGSFVMPGANGGANIPGGSSVDPETGMLFVASERGHSVISLVPGSEKESNAGYVSLGPGGIRGPQGLELFKPPYGTITAYDMNKGEIAWQIPNGDTPDAVKNHPALKGVDLPVTGKRSHATILTTKSLVYYGEGRRGDAFLHALDKKTGKEVGRVELPATTNTAPMTFMHKGRQYIIAAVAGVGSPGELVALALPEE